MSFLNPWLQISKEKCFIVMFLDYTTYMIV